MAIAQSGVNCKAANEDEAQIAIKLYIHLRYTLRLHFVPLSAESSI
jgi:hypothetical protein